MPLDVVSPVRTKDLSVAAPLLFIERGRKKPFVKYGYDTAESETNTVHAPQEVVLRNARLLAPSLDVHGFELAWRPSSVTATGGEDAFLSAGRAEAAELIETATGAARVHVFDHTVRRASPDAPRQPSQRVHNDYTVASAARRVRDLLGEEAEALLQKPFAFVNVWRPLFRPVIDWPLALCDARSVSPADLAAIDIIYPDRVGEIYYASHSPRQRWFYFPEMRLEEALLIKCYDSRPGVASFTPHTSFRNPLAPPGTPPRESVEYRAMAFFA